ncbi:glutamate receptor ionotropic, kainate glr-3-like [Penaeus vannamei]|uniref:glutamate receptor ionotropic, kainate glr-3-like n=1 Tax=Penaeus vannamei TaxID=6689 RepID=UPI00387F79C2
MTSTTKAVRVLMVVLLTTASRGGAEPLVVQMLQDIVLTSDWDHVTMLYFPHNDLLTRTEATQLVVGMMSTRAAAVSFLEDEIYPSVPGQGSEVSRGPSDQVMHVRPPHYRSQFIALWDPDGATAEFMIRAGELGLYTNRQEWLVLLPPNVTLKDAQKDLHDARIYIDSEVLFCQFDPSVGGFSLREVWRVGRGQPFLTGPRGSWTRREGLVTPDLPHKYDRRKDLRGFHLRVATINTMPYEELLQNNTKQNFMGGYVVDVWHTLQEQLNFTYTATDTLFGSLQSDGVTWNGMVGMLQTDDADAAVAPLSITKIRAISIDFTIPIQIVSTRLYIRRPVLEGSWTLYGQPFDGLLWACIPVFLVVCGASLWLLNWTSVQRDVHDHDIRFEDAFWIMFCSIVQQSAMVEPRPMSGRIVFFAGYWTGLILFTCYSAILVSILTTRQPQLPFRDFEGLLNNPDWNLGVRTNTALADALALAPPGSPMRLAWDTFVGKDPVNNLPNNNDDALNSVLKGKYAFFANKEYIIYRLQRVLPLKQAMDIVDTKTDFLKRGIGFGLQKGSPFKNLMNHVLSKMTQKGHLDRLKRKWWPNIAREPEASYPTPGFKEVFTVFIVWGGGIAVSVVLLGCEKFAFGRPPTATPIPTVTHPQKFAFRQDIVG